MSKRGGGGGHGGGEGVEMGEGGSCPSREHPDRLGSIYAHSHPY